MDVHPVQGLTFPSPAVWTYRMSPFHFHLHKLCRNVVMPDRPASGQFGSEMKTMPMLEPARYRTEMSDARMPMPATSTSMQAFKKNCFLKNKQCLLFTYSQSLLFTVIMTWRCSLRKLNPIQSSDFFYSPVQKNHIYYRSDFLTNNLGKILRGF
jgi:hypothetical protein